MVGQVRQMARPIEPTPTLDGEDADRLLESLDKHASPSEMEERQRRAAEYLEEIRKPKGRMTGGEFQFEPTHKLHMSSSHGPDLRSDNRSIFLDLLKKVKDLQESGQLPKHPTLEQVKDWTSAQAALGECERTHVQSAPIMPDGFVTDTGFLR
jgi:hypothetical protein